MASTSSIQLTESFVRPQFNVGGEVSILRSSHPKLSSPTSSEPTVCASLQTTTPTPVTMSDFRSELKPVDNVDMSTKSLNPELFVREFLHDDESGQNSERENSEFKSSFAREVMLQNVKKNVTPARRYIAVNNGDEHYPKTGSFYSVGKEYSPGSNEARLSTSSAKSKRSLNFSSSKFRSQFATRNLLMVDDDSDEWMSSNQFKSYLDNEESLTRSKEGNGNDEFNETQQAIDVDIETASSYLDQDAKMPFMKLKQTCEDLGFTFSEQEWLEMRRLLSVDQMFDFTEEDFEVRNEDFFGAVHLIMSNKHRREESFKYSMKSDSGGEMESCRSSDSELERELHEKEREIQMMQREITSIYRSLAERDTDLVRVRLECQRLFEENRNLREQLARYKLYNYHPKRQLELEKEVDHLRWKLVAMEDSRRTYESATERLVVFLEQVTTMLQATSPSQRKFLESTRAEVSKIAKRTRNQKRFSLESSSMFRAESMPGLHSGLASHSSIGGYHGSHLTSGPYHGSLLSLNTTISGADAMSTSSQRSSTTTIPRRAPSTISSSVQRSHSIQSKRSANLPSVRERRESSDMSSVRERSSDSSNRDRSSERSARERSLERSARERSLERSARERREVNSESIYVNSDIIKEFIAEETAEEIAEIPRPKSAAAILHDKRHVCEIKIGHDHVERGSEKKKRATSTPAKRSNSSSSTSTTTTTTSQIQVPSQKASKILGIEPQQQVIQNFSPGGSSSYGGADSGRFSLGSRSSSISARSSPVITSKSSGKASKSAVKDKKKEVKALPETKPPLLLDNADMSTKTVDKEAESQNDSVDTLIPQEKFVGRIFINGIEEGKNSSNTTQVTSNTAQVTSKEPPETTRKSQKETHLTEDDRMKFKSLGDLHIEKGLPSTPVVLDGEGDDDKKQMVLKAAQSLMRGVKSMITRDKTLTITPKKSSSKSLNSVSLHRHPKPTLQLISHTSFPGLPTYPVLAASHSSPWNC